jgi:carbon monoxide dehydrogenase subunit G
VQLEHSFTVPVGIDEAWGILLDIERVGPCMPGAAIETVDGDDFTGTVKVKLGPINLTYKGKASFTEKDEAAHRAVIDARGKDSRGNGTAAAKVTATLTDDGDNTKVLVGTDLDITGKPAQFGRGVMVDVGNKLIGQFADNLADAIKGGNIPVGSADDAKPAQAEAAQAPAARAAKPRPKPARAAAKAAAAESSGAPEAVADAAPVAEPAAVVEPAPAAESTPSYSAPGGIPETEPAASASSVNGHATGTVRQVPHRDVEPINLIEHAGPAVAKRLAPVAVAALVVLIAVRRRRSNK